MQFDDVARLLKAFEREGVRYVLIGSMAMAARGIRRATQDIDFFIAPDEENVAKLRKAMRSVYDDESIDEIRADDLAGRYPVIRYGPPEGTVMIERDAASARSRRRRGAPLQVRPGGVSMTVQKYHDVADLKVPDFDGSPVENLRAVFDLIALCSWLGPYELRRGVRRYRSLNAKGRSSDRIRVRAAGGRYRD